MTIWSHQDLREKVAEYLARDGDSVVEAQIPGFIQLAEAKLSRLLETREQEYRSRHYVLPGQEHLILPQDLRAIRSARILGSDQSLSYSTPPILHAHYGDTATGVPAAYTLNGHEITLRPIPQAEMEIEIIYIRDMDSLTAKGDEQTNDTIYRYPDAYLYGALAEAYKFLMDEAKSQYYSTELLSVVAHIKQDTEQSRYGGSALQIKTEYGV